MSHPGSCGINDEDYGMPTKVVGQGPLPRVPVSKVSLGRCPLVCEIGLPNPCVFWDTTRVKWLADCSRLGHLDTARSAS